MKTKQDLQLTFGVSPATIQNWIKTKLIPSPSVTGAYSDTTFEEIKAIIDRHDSKLKFRANRKRNDSRQVHIDTLDNKKSVSVVEQIIDIHTKAESDILTTLLALSLALLNSKSLVRFTVGEISNKETATASELFVKFLKSWQTETNAEVLKQVYTYLDETVQLPDEIDLLGTVYQSLRTVSEKSDAGAFFTPSHLLDGIQISTGDRISDPCCGSGRMLLTVISPQHNPALIYASDTDPIALKICRVNLVLFFQSTAITSHIEYRDFIFKGTDEQNLFNTEEEVKFDVVISNPPWGAKFTAQQKKILLNNYPQLKTTESFAICLYNAIRTLKPEGRLHFVLPESILSVDTHYSIRKYALSHSHTQVISRFGSAFKGVVSKVIRLDLYNDRKRTPGTFLTNNNEQVFISEDVLKNDTLQIPVLNNQYEADILKQLFAAKHTSLQGSCVFGLGIVTGDNAEHLLTVPQPNAEPVYKGRDIEPFRMGQPGSYIVFNPDSLQQVAPVHLYRQKKICYRFISDKVIMSIDDNGVLLLNSANFFIPKTELPFEAIAAIFNSSIITFFYQKVFNSFKLLRNHIEDFPLPRMSEEKIQTLVDFYRKGTAGVLEEEKLNHFVGELFGLNLNQIEYISNSLKTNGNQHTT